MPLTGSVVKHNDNTKDIQITGTNDDGTANACLFVQGHKDKPDTPNAPYNVVGAKAGVSTPDGTGASIKAQNIPSFGSQVTASTNVNVVKTDSQRLDVSAFATKNMPTHGPNYASHGVGLDYKLSGGSGIGLLAQNTPTFGKEMKASTNLNILNTNDNKLDLSAYRTEKKPNEGPGYSTQGVELDFDHKDKIGLNASVERAPEKKQTDYSLGGNVNLYKGENTSLDLQGGVNKTDTARGNGKWEKKGAVYFTWRF